MENLNKHIEHTLLKQDAKEEDFIKLFEEAKKHANLYYIMSIATQQAYRQKGFASSLVDHLIRSTNMDIMGDISSMISMSMYYKRGFSANPLGDDYNMVILTR